jgi:hypothetical protein
MSIKSFKPQPLGETKIRRRYPKPGLASSNKNKRPPAKYDNTSWEETINKYLNDGNQIPDIAKVQKRK